MIIAVALTVLVAGATITVVVSSRLAPTSAATPAASDGAEDAHPVSAEDYCYVEAMIFYRVAESQVATMLLAKEGIGADARAFAEANGRRADAELVDLRSWYVSWLDARPAEPPLDGPCAGHGAEHVQMPGIPSRAERDRLIAAQGAAAVQLYATLVRAQNAGMVALIASVLESGPHPRVASSATAAQDQAAADDATLARLSAG
ncbi:MAG: DUF305 domain-containing protein [Actinobacteria bacterium]|nr:DUF305 domain-containing protein [Actinomycetota bacterium]